MKNAAELVGDLVEHFDFSIIESCAAQNSCADFEPFTEQKKPVFQIEYREETGDWASLCRGAAHRGFIAILAGLELDGTAETCPRQ